ncbi:hypothetical protein JTB14_038455 [Gonioctena quinquepunctata]|nr:hypothetical protein JTB14_038455 [Gonioctena quinquepunctata]
MVAECARKTSSTSGSDKKVRKSPKKGEVSKEVIPERRQKSFLRSKLKQKKVQIGPEGKSNWSTWKSSFVFAGGVRGGLEVLEGKLQAPNHQ